MNATESVVDERIARFAADVRHALSDLPEEEVDELLDGLESDLSDQADELDDWVPGDPAVYAMELRTAAGLPAPAKAPALHRSLAQFGRSVADRVAAWMRSSRAGVWLLELFLSLRPLWWLARGWVLFTIVQLPATVGHPGRMLGVPADPLAWFLLAALVLISIQWGRGRWLPNRWIRGLSTAVSVVAGLVLPLCVGLVFSTAHATLTWAANAQYESGYGEPTAGLSIDGERIRNIYAYDASGKPIEVVQLFDQDGRPLNTVGRNSPPGVYVDDFFVGSEVPLPLAHQGTGLLPIWNVYPLAEVPIHRQELLWGGGRLSDDMPTFGGDLAADVAFPRPSVPAISDRTTPTVSATPAVSPTPSVSP